jgi:hypothetical protein
MGLHTSPVPVKVPKDLAEAVATIDPHHSWSTSTLLQNDNSAAITQGIRDGTGIAVSDGSFKDSRSTSAFLLEGPAGASGQDSYQGELRGIVGTLHMAHCIATIHGVSTGRLHLGLDGEEAMKQAAIIGLIHPKMRSFNLLAEIRALRSRLSFTFEFFWIEGHQGLLRTPQRPLRQSRQSLLEPNNGHCEWGRHASQPHHLGIRI